MTPAAREQCSRLQQSRLCRYWYFAAYTATVTCNALQWVRQPLKIAHSFLGIWILDPSIIRGSFGTPESALKRHLDDSDVL